MRDRPISPRSPWQNGYSERLIGSIRRECLDHVVVFGERHLRHLLNSYQKYYNEARTHLSLHKDAPIPRAVQTIGRTLAVSVLGGLHHQYSVVGGKVMTPADPRRFTRCSRLSRSSLTKCARCGIAEGHSTFIFVAFLAQSRPTSRRQSSRRAPRAAKQVLEFLSASFGTNKFAVHLVSAFSRD
jgi:Integrase core domain